MLSDNEGVQWMSEHRFNDFKQVDPFESDTPNAHSHLSPMHYAPFSFKVRLMAMFPLDFLENICSGHASVSLQCRN